MYHIDIQLVVDKTLCPKKSMLRKWAQQTLSQTDLTSAELTLRIVNKEEMTELNETYRKKKGPTNVLSFPFALTEDIELEVPILGDIVICAAIVNEEARTQEKPWDAHWAHMIVHGVFHLLGHDHEIDAEAEVMERLEIAVMNTLGFDNPYKEPKGNNHE